MEVKSSIFYLDNNQEADINLILYIDNIILCGTTYKCHQKSPFCNILICNHQKIYKINSNNEGNYFISMPKGTYNVLAYQKNKCSCQKIELKENINIQNFFL